MLFFKLLMELWKVIKTDFKNSLLVRYDCYSLLVLLLLLFVTSSDLHKCLWNPIFLIQHDFKNLVNFSLELTAATYTFEKRTISFTRP